jgi:hypothetical protein
MVICWACPYDGRNLPADWRDVHPKHRFVGAIHIHYFVGWLTVCVPPRYLYRLILALDANFKMKNRIRAHEHDDPSLGPGWGAFVEPTRYKKHLRGYVAEKDVRSSHIVSTSD